MHTQVMSNNNGSVAQVMSVLDKKIQEAVTELIHAANHAHAKSIKEKNKKLVQMEEDNKKLKVKLAKSIKEKNEMEEENKKLKVTHKEQVLKLKQDHSKKENKMMKRMKKQSDELSRMRQNFQARFVCPITQDVMEDPVLVAQTGNTYERRAVEEWFARSNTDPLTNAELEDATLIPNNVLRCAE